MAEQFNIREYESFVDGSVLEKRGIEPRRGMQPLPHDVFESLEAFVLENRSEATEAIEFMSLGAKKGYGKVITARNYVGTVVFKNGTTIQMLPKLITSQNDDEEKRFAEEQRIFLRMLQAVMDLPMKEFELAQLSTVKMDVQEPFIRMFVRAVADLTKQGLRSAYTELESNERFLKGKVHFAQDVKLNCFHRERFYVRYDEFVLDRPENRVIKSTLILLKGMTRSFTTKRDIDMVLRCFVDIAESANVDQDLAQCHLDRTMSAYVRILKLCQVFLRGESFTSFKGSEVASSLLFPMETLFEAYVAKLVKKQTSMRGWKAVVQDKGFWLYDEPKRFRIRPDIVMYREGHNPIVLDTKWKRIGGSANDGMSQADMYQMYVYQHRYHAAKTILVYPRHEGIDGGHRSSYQSHHSGNSAEIAALNQVFVFDLANADQSASDLIDLAVNTV